MLTSSATYKSESATQKGQFEDIDTTQKREIATQKNLDTTQKKVLEYFKNNPKVIISLKWYHLYHSNDTACVTSNDTAHITPMIPPMTL